MIKFEPNQELEAAEKAYKALVRGKALSGIKEYLSAVYDPPPVKKFSDGHRKKTLAFYWETIPVGIEKAITYEQLARRWGMSRRSVRNILHELSAEDNGDGLILIRSSKNKGFFKTSDKYEIAKYKAEVIHRAQHTCAPLNKIARVLLDK